jgi:endoglucanase
MLSSARAADLRVEAETMALPSGTGAVFNDGAASGGKGLLIWTNAAASKTVTAPASNKVVVRARADNCSGSPRMTVKIDSTTILTATVTPTTWTSYSAAASVASGSRKISVAFTNDYKTKSCDRNLRVDYMTFVSSAVATPTPSPTPTATPTPTPTPSPTPTPTPTATPTPTPPTSATNLYVDPNSAAKQQADAWRSTRPADAAQIDKIAANAQGYWFGEWSGDVRASVDGVVSAAAAASKVPVLVAYNIPQRDCGSYSSGGTTPENYRTWIRAFASGIGSRKAIVVVEPDALAGMSCLSSADQATRVDLLRDAVGVLKAGASTSVYLDAGHSHWLSASDAAERLNNAGVAQADGFSLNVSNFNPTSGEVTYGNQVASMVGNKHFVVDTSRNGLGSNGEWCNPSGRALGEAPTLSTGQALADGYLWVKRPGESDGTCNGGPAAGQWWADYALGLAQRAAW